MFIDRSDPSVHLALLVNAECVHPRSLCGACGRQLVAHWMPRENVQCEKIDYPPEVIEEYERRVVEMVTDRMEGPKRMFRRR